MKTLFILANSTLKIPLKNLFKLPKNLAVVYSVQYKSQAEQVKKLMSKTHNITNFAQVLGCSQLKFPKADAILLIGDGRFHALSFAAQTKLPIYVLNSKLEKISQKEAESFEKKQKGAYLKFLNADKVGILVSTKSGQQNLNKALTLKNKLKNKQPYIFICNNLKTSKFENFPEIQSWVNTACPRLDMNSSSVINMDRLNLRD